MTKINFNEGWLCRRLPEGEPFKVHVPHDAMLLDKRDANSPGGVNSGWYAASDYEYEKSFTADESYADCVCILEFEGVYRNAEVYVNGQKAGGHDYGYTGFTLPVQHLLQFGKQNTVRVVAHNSEQPNCRWYSGCGIYRPVWLHVLPKRHVLPNGVKVTATDVKKPAVKVEVATSCAGRVKMEILDGGKVLAAAEKESSGCTEQILVADGARLWDAEHPNLYTCRVSFGADVQEVSFGIRTIECDARQGLRVNGERVLLRGACIHHDNGLLGAAAYGFAEERKIKLLKEAGYNAVRSAHNPCSAALLDACDRLGMYVMDEYTDGWYIHKTRFDYADYIMQNYRGDLKDMVDKDYNHPSVIMYSTGNEVSETAQEKGIEFCGEMTQYLHDLDSTRPVTCGVNIFFNFLSSMGFGVYSDKKAQQSPKKKVGSEFFNTIAGIFGASFMKNGARLRACDKKTRGAFAKMDVAGYNYGILRYRKDMKKYPERVIVGSETFCSDAYAFYETAKTHPALIGDFVWAGMDYLGEVGIGSWEYRDYAKNFVSGLGWISAGSGRIDLTGKQLAEAAYTRVAFELDAIRIAAVRPDRANEKHSPSAWKMSNAMESWSWNGCNGKKTRVEVYARGHRVKLFVNGKSVGVKRLKKDCKAVFRARYYDGEVKAVVYDKQGKAIAETSLKTAGDETKLTLVPETNRISAEGLAYVRLQYTDGAGTVKPLARGRIQVSVTGGTLLALGHACPYNDEGYLSNRTDTYYGEALAIVKPDGIGKITVRAHSDAGDAVTTVTVD